MAQKLAPLTWHLTQDFLLPIAESHIKSLDNELKMMEKEGELSEEIEFDYDSKLEAWKKIKKSLIKGI